MSEHQEQPESSGAEEPKSVPSKKKPYQPPAIEVEGVFERMALTACIKNDSTCDPGPIQS